MEPNYEYRYKQWGEDSWEPVYVDKKVDTFYRQHAGEWGKVIVPWSRVVNDNDSEVRPLGKPKDDSLGNVNSPSHYGQGSIEAIEYIKDNLTTEEYIGYLRGNIAKYLHRWRYKNGLEDLKKAQVYLGWLIDTVGKERHAS